MEIYLPVSQEQKVCLSGTLILLPQKQIQLPKYSKSQTLMDSIVSFLRGQYEDSNLPAYRFNNIEPSIHSHPTIGSVIIDLQHFKEDEYTIHAGKGVYVHRNTEFHRFTVIVDESLFLPQALKADVSCSKQRPLWSLFQFCPISLTLPKEIILAENTWAHYYGGFNNAGFGIEGEL